MDGWDHMLDRVNRFEDPCSLIPSGDPGEDILSEHSGLNVRAVFRRLRGTTALQDYNRVSIKSQLVCLFVPDDLCPRFLHPTQVAGYFLVVLVRKRYGSQIKLVPQGSVNLDVALKFLVAMLAIALPTGSGRPDSPRTSPGVLPAAGGISTNWSNDWRAVSAFSRYRRVWQRSEIGRRCLSL